MKGRLCRQLHPVSNDGLGCNGVRHTSGTGEARELRSRALGPTRSPVKAWHREAAARPKASSAWPWSSSSVQHSRSRPLQTTKRKSCQTRGARGCARPFHCRAFKGTCRRRAAGQTAGRLQHWQGNQLFLLHVGRAGARTKSFRVRIRARPGVRRGPWFVGRGAQRRAEKCCKRAPYDAGKVGVMNSAEMEGAGWDRQLRARACGPTGPAFMHCFSVFLAAAGAASVLARPRWARALGLLPALLEPTSLLKKIGFLLEPRQSHFCPAGI